MRIRGPLVTGVFNRRPNRFTALASIDGREVRCFLPNPGRMGELLVPGVKVVLREVEARHRKTRYDLIAVYNDGRLVSIDSRVPNRLLLESLKEGGLEEFFGYSVVKPEYVYGESRFDFLLINNVEKCLVEVKSCTLVRNGVALFPDAPTARGRRHLLELARAKREGYRACVVFVIQRTDVDEFSPNDETDPEFGKTLREAAADGVEVYAYSSELMGNEVFLRKRVRVNLGNLKQH